MRSLLLSVFVMATVLIGYCQDKETSLFKYPEVPDTMSTLAARSDFYVAHFWDKCNLSKPFADDAKLARAFEDYIIFFQWANKTVVRSSVNNLMNKAQSNMPNFRKLAQLAEYFLYSAGSQYQSDEAYIFFVNNILRSSRVKGEEKDRYKDQLAIINQNQIGVLANNFDFKDCNGDSRSLYDLKCETIIIIIAAEDNADCSISRLRLSTNVAINRLIEEGRLMIVNVDAVRYSSEWAEATKLAAPQWVNASCPDIVKLYDLRINPAIYILDSEKKIINKNISADSIIQALAQ